MKRAEFALTVDRILSKIEACFVLLSLQVFNFLFLFSFLTNNRRGNLAVACDFLILARLSVGLRYVFGFIFQNHLILAGLLVKVLFTPVHTGHLFIVVVVLIHGHHLGEILGQKLSGKEATPVLLNNSGLSVLLILNIKDLLHNGFYFQEHKFIEGSGNRLEEAGLILSKLIRSAR